MIPVCKPYLPKYSLSYCYDAIESGWISSLGKYKILVEEKLKELFGYKYVLLTSSGTTANQIMAKVLRYYNPYYAVVPNNVYVAAWNTFEDNDFELVPIDADLNTWNFNTSFILDNKCVILVVHNLGNPIDVLKLKDKFPSAFIVEDNCEGFLGKYPGGYTGSQSLCSSISFFANKNITCGEGGAFITSDENIYEYAKLYHGQGQSDKRYIHSMLGYNFRMTNIQAAILLGQLEILDEIIERKAFIFDYYRSKFSGCPYLEFQSVEEGCSHSNWMFGLRAVGGPDYEITNKFFLANGIETRPLFYPITYHEHFKYIQCDIKNAAILSKEGFILPSYVELSKNDLDQIINTIFNFIKEYI